MLDKRRHAEAHGYRAMGVTEVPPRERASVLVRFPVTTCLALPYIFLFLPAAMLGRNPEIPFILKTWGLAVVAPLVLELLLSRRKGANTPRVVADAIPPYLAQTTLIVGLTTSLGNVLQGVGSVADQSSGVATAGNWLVSLFSLFSYWPVIGLAMLAAQFHQGRISRKQILSWYGLAIGVELLETWQTAIVAPLISLTITCAVLLVYVKALAPRWILLAVLVALPVWPTVFAIRNAIREAQGVATVSQGAFDRLRYDLQIARAAHLPVPLDVGQPRGGEVIRYGLVPRVLDPGRPVISTGVRIASYLSGVSTPWAYTFLPIATMYVFEGGGFLPVFYGAIAIAVHLLLRGGQRVTSFRLALFGLLVSGPLGWFATYPDSTIGMLQGVVSMLPIVLAGAIVKRDTRRKAGNSRLGRELRSAL